MGLSGGLVSNGIWSGASLPTALPVFSVSSYGATGNGVTDDYAAVQSAINAVLASTSQSGILYFPPGTYMMNGAGVVGNSWITPAQSTGFVWLMGAGMGATTVTTTTDNANFKLFTFRMPHAQTDMTIDFNGKQAGGINSQIRFLNEVDFTGAAGSGIPQGYGLNQLAGTQTTPQTVIQLIGVPNAAALAVLVAGNLITFDTAGQVNNNGECYVGTIASYNAGTQQITVNVNTNYPFGLRTAVTSGAPQSLHVGTALNPQAIWYFARLRLQNNANSQAFMMNISDPVNYYPFQGGDCYLEDLQINNLNSTQEGINLAGFARFHIRNISAELTGLAGGRAPFNLFTFDEAYVENVAIKLGTATNSSTLTLGHQCAWGKGIIHSSGLNVDDPNGVGQPITMGGLVRASHWHLPEGGNVFPKLDNRNGASPQSQTITALTFSGTTITATVTSTAGLVVGQEVRISGITFGAAARNVPNGLWPVASVVNNTQFTYVTTGATPTGAYASGGTVTWGPFPESGAPTDDFTFDETCDLKSGLSINSAVYRTMVKGRIRGRTNFGVFVANGTGAYDCGDVYLDGAEVEANNQPIFWFAGAARTMTLHWRGGSVREYVGLQGGTGGGSLNTGSIIRNVDGLSTPPPTAVVAVPLSGVAVVAVAYDRIFQVNTTGAGSTTITIQNGPTYALLASTSTNQAVFVPANLTMTPTYANAPTWTVYTL